MSRSSVRPGAREEQDNPVLAKDQSSGKSAYGDGPSNGCTHVDPGAASGGFYRYAFADGADRQHPSRRGEIRLERIGYECATCGEIVLL